MDTQNKIYLLNLQQQVRKNQLMIESLAQGLRIIGAGETLPEQAAEMDAYLLSEEDGYSLYLRISGEWVDMGRFPAQGEPGPAGPKGSVGTIGSIVCNATPIDFGLNPSVSATVSGDNVTFNFELPRGETGIQGPQGPQGPRGLTGPRGLQGQQGDPGKAFRLFQNDSVVTTSDLPAASTAGEGVGYLVGTLGGGYELYVTANDPLEWVDAGPFIPNQTVVDQSLDYSSDEAVANKPVSYALAYGWSPDVTIAENVVVPTSSNLHDAVRYGFPFWDGNRKYNFVDAYSTGGQNQFRVYVSITDALSLEMVTFYGAPLTSYLIYKKKSVTLAKDSDVQAEIARATRQDEIHQREIVLLKNLVYDTIAASYSYNIDYAFYASVPASVEVSGQYHSILDDAGAQVEKITGSSVVWNQMVKSQILAGASTVTVSEGVFTINGTQGVTDSALISQETQEAGHKYLIYCIGADNDVYLQWYSLGSDTIISRSATPTIVTASTTASAYVAIRVATGTYSNRKLIPKIFDITKIFPTDTPTSVDDPRINAILASDELSHSEPVLKSSIIKAVRSRGFNLWDEQWEVGTINSTTGQNESASNRLRSKNYILVTPGSLLYFNCVGYNTITNGFLLYQYDADKNFISYGIKYAGAFNISTNCVYIRFCMGTGYGTTYNNDICINRSNVALNGTHKPHVADQLVDLEALGLTEAQRTLRSTGTARDELSLVEQQDGTYNLVKNTLIGIVDLGTLSWNYQADYGTQHENMFISGLLPNGKPHQAGNPKILNSKYVPINSNTQFTTLSDKTISIYSNTGTSSPNVYIRDSSYTGAATFKAAMSGVYLFYELASPTSETLLTGLEFGAIELIVERGGSFNVDADNAEYGAVPGLVMDLPILIYE